MMNIGRVLLGTLLVFAVSGVSSAGEIQCKRILKYLSTGRTPSEVAETMVISEDDVVACKEEADAAAADEKAGGDAKDGAAAKE